MLNIDNNLFELVLEQIGCISIVDTQSRYVYVNDYWVNCFGITREEVIGKHAHDVLSYTKIDIAVKTGKPKFSDDINNYLENDIIFTAYIPLIEGNVIVGGLTYTEFRDMKDTFVNKKLIEKFDQNYFSKIVCMDKVTDEKLNNLIHFDNLKLKEKQDILIKEILVDALEKSNGNKSNAAKLLGISRTVIYDKLKKYNLM